MRWHRRWLPLVDQIVSVNKCIEKTETTSSVPSCGACGFSKPAGTLCKLLPACSYIFLFRTRWSCRSTLPNVTYDMTGTYCLGRWATLMKECFRVIDRSWQLVKEGEASSPITCEQ